MNQESKKDKKPWMLVLLQVLIGLSLVAVAIFAYIYLKADKEYKVGNDYYESIRTDQITVLEVMRDADAANVPPSTPSSVSAQSPEQPAEVEQNAPSQGSMVFTYLETINQDVVAWITADGLPIDLPIVQGDDNDYYLTHLFDHQINRLGTLFVDVNNQGDFSDKNTAVYGHNMNDGSMFASLMNYQSQEFFESFPEMDLYTPTSDYKIELFAGMVHDGAEPFIRFSFHDDFDFLSYVDYLKQNSTFDSPVSVEPEDQIITLSTCTPDYYNNKRYVVYGRLVPKK